MYRWSEVLASTEAQDAVWIISNHAGKHDYQVVQAARMLLLLKQKKHKSNTTDSKIHINFLIHFLIIFSLKLLS